MNDNMRREIEGVLTKHYNPDYFLHQTPTVFHVSEAAKCSYAVHMDRKHNKYKAQLGNQDGLFEPDNANFVLGRAYENYIAYKLTKGYKNGYSFKRHIPVFIPFDYGCGFKGAPDLMFREGNLLTPIEIKTTAVQDIEYFANSPKLLIQGCAYGFGCMSPIWVLIAAAKKGGQQTYLEKRTNTRFEIKGHKYDIHSWLKLKYIDLTGKPKDSDFSPMFNWECNYCDHKKRCPFYKNIHKT